MFERVKKDPVKCGVCIHTSLFLLFGIRIEIASHKLIYRLLEFILVFLSHITGERTKVETEMRMKAKEMCAHITFTKC